MVKTEADAAASDSRWRGSAFQPFPGAEPEQGSDDGAGCERQQWLVLPRVAEGRECERDGATSTEQRGKKPAGGHARKSRNAGDDLWKDGQPTGQHHDPAAGFSKQHAAARVVPLSQQSKRGVFTECATHGVGNGASQGKAYGADQSTEPRSIEDAECCEHDGGWDRQDEVRRQQRDRGEPCPSTMALKPGH